MYQDLVPGTWYSYMYQVQLYRYEYGTLHLVPGNWMLEYYGYQILFKDTGRGRTRTGRHTQNADRGRATPHSGTNPHTGQNRGQDTPGSDQEQNGRDNTAQKQPRDPTNRDTVPGDTGTWYRSTLP